MRVLIDTNIALDFLLQREPFFQDAELLFQSISEGKIVGYVTATTLTDIFYIARRHTRDVEQARQSVSIILAIMEICPVDRTVLKLAFDSKLADFEDAVQIFSGVVQDLEAIVTCDIQGFLSSPLPTLSIQDLLQRVKQKIIVD